MGNVILRVLATVILLWVSLFGLSYITRLTTVPDDVVAFAGLIGPWVLLAINVMVLACLWKAPAREWLARAKKQALFAALFLLSTFVTGCGYTTIPPGYVGIKVNNWGTQRGVADFPIQMGRVSYNWWTEDVIVYPTFTQTAVWTHSVNEGNPINEEITFTNKDQLSIAADISLAYEMVPDKVPAFYVKFRTDDVNKFTHGFLRNLARQEFDSIAGKYPIESIMGDNADLLEEVRSSLQKEIEPYGVRLSQFGFIGAPRPPAAVIEAINMKIKATQDAMRTENELRQATAEAQKSIAWAEGQAKSNRVLAESVTPALLEWKRIELQFRITDKWNGNAPMYYSGVVGALGGGLTPFLQVPNPSAK